MAHSSQAIAIDVFGTLKMSIDRDRVLDAIARLVDVAPGGPWSITLECGLALGRTPAHAGRRPCPRLNGRASHRMQVYRAGWEMQPARPVALRKAPVQWELCRAG